MSDEIWTSAQSEPAVPTTEKMQNSSALISSIQRSLLEIDKHSMSQDLVAQVLTYLWTLSPDSTGAVEAVAALGQQYAQWTREKGVLSDALWFQVAEIGAWLAIHGNPEALRKFQTSLLQPTSVPHKDTFCDHHRQVAFVTRFFDALCGPAVARSLSQDAVQVVVEVYVAWLARVMGEYEFIFLHHIAQPLVAHIQQTHRLLPEPLARAATAIVESRMTKHWQREASSIAVASILVSASAHATANGAIQTRVVQELQFKETFPHVHRPVAILAAALQAAPLAVVSSPLIHQFLLLRVVHLALVSSQLLIRDFKLLSERYQESLYRSRLSENEVDVCLRILDASTRELQTAMDTSPAIHLTILHAMRSNSATELFRPSLIVLQEQIELQSGNSEPAFPAQSFLATYYDAVTIGIQAFAQSPSPQTVLHCFAVLSRLEFARECCATSQRNATMLQLTQRVEDLIESAPDATLSTIATSLLSPVSNHQSMSLHTDVVFGGACLAVGLLVQRKLRVVLFQASDATRRDAFAVVFAGLYHGLEPLDTFAHRFFGFALASLGQFVSVYEVFPFYLQKTLRLFPSDVPKPQVAGVIGTVFGALYYTNPTQAVTVDEKRIEATATETRHAMILWALRQTRQRAEALLHIAQSEADLPSDGLYLVELFLEVAKMAPVELLSAIAREMEALVHSSAEVSERLLHEVKTRVFNAVAVNCEAEKRAWLAAWFLELSAAYPTSPLVASDVVDDAQALSADSLSTAPQAISRL